MQGWVLGAVAAGAVGAALLAIAWWRASRRRRRAPELRATPELERALAEALRAPEPAARVERALLACVHEDRPWRDGLRRVSADLASLGDGADQLALRAEVEAWLGAPDEAERTLARVPPEHWRGCLVRAVIYASRGDLQRSEHALVAASHLAPPDRRALVAARLAAHRRRAPRKRSAAELLFDG